MYAAVPGGAVTNVGGGSGLSAGDGNPQEGFENAAEYTARYRAQAEYLSRAGVIPTSAMGTSSANGARGAGAAYSGQQQQQQWPLEFDISEDGKVCPHALLYSSNFTAPFSFIR